MVVKAKHVYSIGYCGGSTTLKYLFAREHTDILEHFAWSNVLLALDYDGTLSPIVDEPSRASMRTSTRHLLDRAVVLFPCAVISGRARSDAKKRLGGSAVHEIVGNHGLEPSESSERYERLVAEWIPKLQKTLAEHTGIHVEDKRFSLAIHYRRCRQKKLARAAIAAAVATLGPVRVIGGKQVVNVLPDGAPHKGIALEKVRAKLGCDTAIYVGDDVTDEDVFALDEPGRLLCVRVGRSSASQAAYFIKDQLEIDRLLRTLVERREAMGQRIAR